MHQFWCCWWVMNASTRFLLVSYAECINHKDFRVSKTKNHIKRFLTSRFQLLNNWKIKFSYFIYKPCKLTVTRRLNKVRFKQSASLKMRERLFDVDEYGVNPAVGWRKHFRGTSCSIRPESPFDIWHFRWHACLWIYAHTTVCLYA